MQKIVVLGGSGLVGNALIKEMNRDKEFELYGTYAKNPVADGENRYFPLDVEDIRTLYGILDLIKPQIVVSCLRGDFDKQLILHVELAKYLKRVEGRLYFCSTANVFDANEDVNRHHYEEDAPNAASEYGRFKAECEKRIVEILGEKACILRLPQVWGKNSRIMDKVIQAVANKESIEVYPNIFYNTNTDIILAKQIHYIIRQGEKGVFHLAAEDVISHRDFYDQLLLGLGHATGLLRENPEGKGSLALLSRRMDIFPEELRIRNASVVKYLIGGSTVQG